MDLAYIDNGSAKSVTENLSEITKGIDDVFGKGYAKAHPELVGSMVKAAAVDYLGTVLHFDMESLNSALSSISDALETD